jgi:hypothetical protein
MDINFQQLMAEAGEGFQPIPPGPYTVECEKAEATTSSTSKPQIKVTLRVLGGQHNGRKLFDQFTLTAGNPTALGFFFDNCASFGLDRSFFAQLQMENPMPYVAQMLLGRQANVTVVMEPYQGVDRNKIKQYRPVAGGQPQAAGMVAGMPAQIPAPGQYGGASPVAPAPQPQFAPQPPPPGFPPQQPYAPQAPQSPAPPVMPQMPTQGFPQVPQPQVPPAQEAPWQQQPAQQYATQPAVDTQQYPAGLQVQPQQQAPQPQPVAPGDQNAQPGQAPMWQPSGPPPGYVDPSQQQAPPQQQQQYAPQPPQYPQGVPPMPGRSI